MWESLQILLGCSGHGSTQLKDRGGTVRASLRFSTISRLGGALAAAWLCGTGPAWAGSGASAGTLQLMLLNPLCGFLGISTACPQLPTVVQIVQEVAGLDNVAPNFVSSTIIPGVLGLDQTSGACTVAGNAFVPCNALAVNAVNPIARASIGPSDLSSLTPLAFMSIAKQQATPVPVGTSGENSFFYAVTSEASGQHTLDLFLDFPGWTQKQFAKGQSVATITLPLVTFDGTTETPVLATLNVTATCNGAAVCLTGTVTGIPGTAMNPPSAAQLGIQFGYQFGPSPNSQIPHGVLEVTLPVVVTLANDPAYFGISPVDNTITLINQSSGLPTAFSNTEAGFAVKVLGTGISVGVAPYAAPLCTDASCPSDPTVTPITNYGFCASVGGISTVAAFVSIGTDGTTYASSQVAAPQPVCPTPNSTVKVAAH
jgi:hypothetical protein